MSELLFTCFIPGRPIVKKNSGKTVACTIRGKRTMRRVPSAKYSAWGRIAQLKIGQQLAKDRHFKTITTPINAKLTFYFKNRASEADLSNLYEGIQDELKKMKVIEDDKLINGHDGSRRVFDGAEGLLVELFSMEGES